MSVLVDSERETLEALLASEGWKLLTAYIDKEWGAAGFGDKVARTIGNPQVDHAVAVAQLQQATVAQKAVLAVRDWPQQRLHYLQRQAQPQEGTMSRRGPGL